MIRILSMFLLLSFSCRSTQSSQTQEIELAMRTRESIVQKAHVFQGIEDPVSKTEQEIMDGPFPPNATPGKDYFSWGQEVFCLFSKKNFDTPLPGASPKFFCDIVDENDQVIARDVKIKYDKSNPEVYMEPAAARLLWLLGFPTDYYYSVQVKCIGCPSKEDTSSFIKRYRKANSNEKAEMRATIAKLRQSRIFSTYEPALMERKWAEPVVVKGIKFSGWSFIKDLAIPRKQLNFPEEMIDAEEASRHALIILAAMLGHIDNQLGSQRIYCTQSGSDGTCEPDQYWLLINELGLSMGGFRLSSAARTEMTDQAQLALGMNSWANDQSSGVFTTSDSCEVTFTTLSKEQLLGPMRKIKVSDAGRRFLISRFVALGGGEDETWTVDLESLVRQQLAKVFVAGRNGELYQDTNWWVDTLMKKFDLVRNYKGCL